MAARKKVNIDPEALFVGIVEHNDNEGETFGYYFPKTDQSCSAIKKMAEIARDEEGWDFVYRQISGAELLVLEKNDENGYMPRVNVLDATTLSWDELVDKVRAHVDSGYGIPLYKGKFITRA